MSLYVNSLNEKSRVVSVSCRLNSETGFFLLGGAKIQTVPSPDADSDIVV